MRGIPWISGPAHVRGAATVSSPEPLVQPDVLSSGYGPKWIHLFFDPQRNGRLDMPGYSQLSVAVRLLLGPQSRLWQTFCAYRHLGVAFFMGPQNGGFPLVSKETTRKGTPKTRQTQFNVCNHLGPSQIGGFPVMQPMPTLVFSSQASTTCLKGVLRFVSCGLNPF